MSAAEAGPPDVAEEAARLLRVLRETAAAWSPPASGARRDVGPDVGRDAGPDGGRYVGSGPAAGTPPRGHPSTCSVCPLCIAARRLQSAHPEVVDHLVDAAGSLLAALSAVVGDRPPAGPDAGGLTAPMSPGDRTGSADPRPHVEHIVVGE